MQSIIDAGVAFIVYLQTTFVGLAGFFNVFTMLGDEEFYLIVLPFLYWCVDSRLRLRVGIFFAASVVVNDVFKLLLHQPRPYWASTRVQLLTSPSSAFGVPSGHAQNAVVFWGALAASFKNRLYWAAAIVIMLLIAVSRIYLGVHFPHDTLLGLVIGIALLGYLLRRENRAVAWVASLTTRQQMQSIFAISIAGICAALLAVAVTTATWTFPLDWVNNAAIQAPDEPIGTVSAAGSVTIMAVFAGLLIGHVQTGLMGRFDGSGSVGQKFGRFLIGIIGVILIWRGLDVLFGLVAQDETILGYLLRYVRYFSVGLWIGFGAPLLFQRLKLA